MEQTNFLLASSAIIPLLALTLLIELRFLLQGSSLKGGVPGSMAALGVFLWIAAIACFGEWICLRSLELDRLAFGGTLFVWFAIANQTGALLFFVFVLILLGDPSLPRANTPE